MSQIKNFNIKMITWSPAMLQSRKYFTVSTVAGVMAQIVIHSAG